MLFDLNIVPEPVKRLQKILAPQKAYVVGGILRDSIALMDMREKRISCAKGHDWDLATPLRPNEVMKRLRRAGIVSAPIGFEHGTVAAIIENVQYEITTFRYDLEYRDGRHPIVRFADDLDEDLQRRDFTINALALDLETGEIIDRFEGIADLRERLIRTVGEPEVRFQEDYLRMLRAARFSAKLEGRIDGPTFQSIGRNAHRIAQVSPERIRDELMKMMTYPHPSHGFWELHRCGLLLYLLPELEAGFGAGQNVFHADDVAWHSLHAVDAVNANYPFLRFVTLLHDVGKVPLKRFLPQKGDYVFYGHQYASKRMAVRLMRRLRFSNKEIETASSIIENHMYNLKPGLSEGASRRFLRRLGRENIAPFLRMRMADRKGNRLNDDGYEKGIFNFLRNVRRIERAEDALKVQDLEISGHDLIAMSLRPGPVFAQILDQLLDEVLDDPARNDREWLLRRAEEFAGEYKATGTITFPPKEESREDEEG